MWLCGPLKQLVYGNMAQVFSARYKIKSYILAYIHLPEKLLMEFCFGNYKMVKKKIPVSPMPFLISIMSLTFILFNKIPSDNIVQTIKETFLLR